MLVWPAAEAADRVVAACVRKSTQLLPVSAPSGKRPTLLLDAPAEAEGGPKPPLAGPAAGALGPPGRHLSVGVLLGRALATADGGGPGSVRNCRAGARVPTGRCGQPPDPGRRHPGSGPGRVPRSSPGPQRPGRGANAAPQPQQPSPGEGRPQGISSRLTPDHRQLRLGWLTRHSRVIMSP